MYTFSEQTTRIFAAVIRKMSVRSARARARSANGNSNSRSDSLIGRRNVRARLLMSRVDEKWDNFIVEQVEQQ